MDNLRAECSFHAVGQGLFYSAVITSESGNRRKSFFLVYDCGNKNNEKLLSDEIEKHKKVLAPNTKKGKIDLLVLSHFHDDHISGLPRLFECFDISTVVIPYYSPIHLFSYVAGCEKLTTFYEIFYADPIQYFVNCGVKNIEVIGQPMDDAFEKGYIANDDDFYERESNEDDLDFDKQENASVYVNNTRVHYYQDQEKFGLRAKQELINWEFVFYCKMVNTEKLKNLGRFIEGYKTINGFIDIPSLIKNKVFVRKLKSEYKKLAVDLNNTSMMLYHGPIMNTNNPYEHTTLLVPTNPFSFFSEAYNRTGTLLTGDIIFDVNELASIERVVNEIQVFLVPHHGAASSFGASAINVNRNLFYVICYGLTNTYGHPSRSIFEKILKNGNFISQVNERINFQYTIWYESK